jgi:hypothetical protein
MKTRKSMVDLMATATPATIEPAAVPAPKPRAAKPAVPVEQLTAVTVRPLKHQALDAKAAVPASRLPNYLSKDGSPGAAPLLLQFDWRKR